MCCNVHYGTLREPENAKSYIYTPNNSISFRAKFSHTSLPFEKTGNIQTYPNTKTQISIYVFLFWIEQLYCNNRGVFL